jgi:hypothetical protein
MMTKNNGYIKIWMEVGIPCLKLFSRNSAEETEEDNVYSVLKTFSALIKVK